MVSAGGVISIYGLAANVANQTLDRTDKAGLSTADEKVASADSDPCFRGRCPE
jgi:hypothetical protein